MRPPNASSTNQNNHTKTSEAATKEWLLSPSKQDMLRVVAIPVEVG